MNYNSYPWLLYYSVEDEDLKEEKMECHATKRNLGGETGYIRNNSLAFSERSSRSVVYSI